MKKQTNQENKYFVVSDIHGFATELKQGLFKSGFRKTNKNHILIVVGDLLDRGQEALEVYRFINSIPKNRRILIRGNHETLFLELLTKRYPEPHDFHNMTVDTFCQLAGCGGYIISEAEQITMSDYFEANCHYSYGYFDNVQIESSAEYDWNKVKLAVAEHPITKWFKSNEWKDYYEVGDYIFTHSFIPVKLKDRVRKELGIYAYGSKSPSDYEYDPDWRNTPTFAFDEYRWGCPWSYYKAGLFNEEAKKGKILVCGHWHTSDFFKYLGDYGKNNLTKIFCGDNIIGIDGGVQIDYIENKSVLVHKQNVLIIKDNKAYDTYGIKIGLQMTSMEPQSYTIESIPVIEEK